MRLLAVWTGLSMALALSAWGWLIYQATGAPDPMFEARVRDYILQHPDVIIQAVSQRPQTAQVAQSEDMRSIIAARRDEIFNDPDAPIGGDPAGDVSIVEFFDYNCPYCRRVAPTLAELERTDSNLRFVYKEWPILGPNSEFAARAALASRKQGKYVEFHKAMMQATTRMAEDKVMEIAKSLGIDVEQLKKDMEDPAIAAVIERNNDLAQALRITGTPGFVINEETLPGLQELATFQTVIARARGQ